jgi:hypothetical protein
VRERRKLDAWCEEKRGHGGGFYSCSGLYHKGNEPNIAMDMIH